MRSRRESTSRQSAFRFEEGSTAGGGTRACPDNGETGRGEPRRGRRLSAPPCAAVGAQERNGRAIDNQLLELARLGSGLVLGRAPGEDPFPDVGSVATMRNRDSLGTVRRSGCRTPTERTASCAVGLSPRSGRPTTTASERSRSTTPMARRSVSAAPLSDLRCPAPVLRGTDRTPGQHQPTRDDRSNWTNRLTVAASARRFVGRSPINQSCAQ
jgi:hypothetical protein